MNHLLKKFARDIFGYCGFRISKIKNDPIIEDDQFFQEIYRQCREYTMTSKERMYALYKATEYILENKLPGDFVECGVWRGGSAMIIAQVLLKNGVSDKKIYLYDTFAGMSEPTAKDVSLSGEKKALKEWPKKQKSDHNDWDYASLKEVKKNLNQIGYPMENIFFVQGKVEETLPQKAPSQIALLRLDTDWYASTKHELEQLFPRLILGGVLLLDDYGHWFGCKQAVDEYFKGKRIFLGRIDFAGRIGIKTDN